MLWAPQAEQHLDNISPLADTSLRQQEPGYTPASETTHRTPICSEQVTFVVPDYEFARPTAQTISGQKHGSLSPPCMTIRYPVIEDSYVGEVTPEPASRTD